MTILLIVLTSVAAYLLVGLLYARSQIHCCVARANREWSSEDSRRESVYLQLAWRAVLWPAAVIVDFATKRPLRDRLWQPYVEQQERLERLAADRRAWRERALAGTPDERRMAADIVAVLDDILAREGSSESRDG
jgi:hypothetical protein